MIGEPKQTCKCAVDSRAAGLEAVGGRDTLISAMLTTISSSARIDPPDGSGGRGGSLDGGSGIDGLDLFFHRDGLV